ncbi:MAG TPA: helix-turn-helix transcriptional regulator, partial [Bordetella sp.]|nr:helix-turn-helix transcriptional regulator [Bordetella sp.]
MNKQVNERIEFVARQLGARIRKARQTHRITLEGLSQETGLSAGFLSRLERGEASASISNLIAIATHLDIPLR